MESINRLIIVSFLKVNIFDNDIGNRAILPKKILDTYYHYLDSGDPLTFSITTENNLKYHIGVIEFTADDDMIYVPSWILKNLKLNEGDIIDLKYVPLKKATKIIIEPIDNTIFQFNDLKSTFEIILKNFICVTKGTTISITYENKDFELFIKDVFSENSLHNVFHENISSENMSSENHLHNLYQEDMSSENHLHNVFHENMSSENHLHNVFPENMSSENHLHNLFPENISSENNSHNVFHENIYSENRIHNVFPENSLHNVFPENMSSENHLEAVLLFNTDCEVEFFERIIEKKDCIVRELQSMNKKKHL